MLGPAPFRFELQAEKVEGAAFSVAFKTLTCAVVLICGYWLLSLWLQGKFGGAANLEGLRIAGWFILGWGLLACTAWFVVISRIRLDTTGITQSWMWTKHFDFDDLAVAQPIRVRGLEWLIAPRLYVRTLAGKFSVFYVSDTTVLLVMERLSLELKAFRQMEI
jgi:hypothetical protein